MTNVLLIGSGGREHALAWKLRQSPELGALHIAPGNAGMADCGDCISLDILNHRAVVDYCRLMAIDLVIVGPEAPLVDGLCDSLHAAGIAAFGPSKIAAQLEGSKAFTKEVCSAAGIPTAVSKTCHSAAEAMAYLHQQGAPIVVKADGLAAGKGVTVAMTLEAAQTAIEQCFDGEFGEAGAIVVLEDLLIGAEASFFALCDGKSVLPMTSAQDHKRIGEGDTGPNTGGMGAYSPAPMVDAAAQQQIMERIIEPTLEEMARRGAPFKGVLFAGLMMTNEGPSLIEYNCRFGDPECQVMMMRMKSDLLPLLRAAASGGLAEQSITWHDEPAMTVVMAAQGYPGSYAKGEKIDLPEPEDPGMTMIFHAGTKQAGADLVSNGGRVLNITARGATIDAAAKSAYALVDKVDWPGGIYRRDIGWQVLGKPPN